MQKELLESVLEINPATPGSPEDDEEVLCELVEDPPIAAQANLPTFQRLGGVVIGTLVGLNDVGDPLVDFPANGSGAPVAARSAVTVGQHEIGRETVLTFEGANLELPIIMGLIQPAQAEKTIAAGSNHRDGQRSMVAEVDGERLVFTAEKEIVLRCGKASITLTRAGKVLIRGAYLLSRSSGVNRIKGGSIQLN
jgi:hypothetical protein